MAADFERQGNFVDEGDDSDYSGSGCDYDDGSDSKSDSGPSEDDGIIRKESEDTDFG